MKTYHFMAPQVDVWSRYKLEQMIAVGGVTISVPDQKVIGEFLGMTVVENSALPPGRCEFRNPVTGELLLAFDVK